MSPLYAIQLLIPFYATVCPYEAQDYSDDTDTQVDAVEMPEFIYLILTDFVNKNVDNYQFSMCFRLWFWFWSKSFSPSKYSQPSVFLLLLITLGL